MSDVEARGEPHWVESIKIEPLAEEGVLGEMGGVSVLPLVKKDDVNVTRAPPSQLCFPRA